MWDLRLPAIGVQDGHRPILTALMALIAHLVNDLFQRAPAAQALGGTGGTQGDGLGNSGKEG